MAAPSRRRWRWPCASSPKPPSPSWSTIARSHESIISARMPAPLFGGSAPSTTGRGARCRSRLAVMFDAIVFAGGGNRCYWQGGFYEAAADRLGLRPPLAVGVSAGAFAGIYSLLGIGGAVRARVLPACGPHLKNFDVSGWRAGGPLCPVGPLYRALIDGMIDAAALARLQHLTDLHIAVTRLPRGVPPLLGAALGIGAY